MSSKQAVQIADLLIAIKQRVSAGFYLVFA